MTDFPPRVYVSVNGEDVNFALASSDLSGPIGVYELVSTGRTQFVEDDAIPSAQIEQRRSHSFSQVGSLAK